MSWPLTQARTLWRRARRAVDIGDELAVDRGPNSVEAGREGNGVELAIDAGQYSVEACKEGGGYWC